MMCKIDKKVVSITVGAFALLVIVLHHQDVSQLYNQYGSSYITPATNFPEVNIYKCKETREFYGGIKAQICLKPLDVDIYISNQIDNWGSFEGAKVSVTLKAMSMYPSAVFLDIGSNIGMYTTVMAAAGYKVVAVDAMLQNLAYIQHSLIKGNTTENVTLLNYPVSCKVEPLVPVLEDLSNEGATRLVPVDMLTGKEKAVGPQISSTTFLDLLNYINADTVIVKMDVEGYECKILHQYLSHPHPPYYLPYISMEWRLTKNCPYIEEMVEGLYTNHYIPIRNGQEFSEDLKDQEIPDLLEKIPKDQLLSRNADLLWAHKDAPPLFW